jgi:fatty-acyl-CoA synthase
MTELTTSYVHGVSRTPLIGATVGVLFDRTVEQWPDNPALVIRHQNLRWSYRELQSEVDALAAGLIALGLAPGDRLGIWSPNNAEWVVTQFATAPASRPATTSGCCTSSCPNCSKRSRANSRRPGSPTSGP